MISEWIELLMKELSDWLCWLKSTVCWASAVCRYDRRVAELPPLLIARPQEAVGYPGVCLLCEVVCPFKVWTFTVCSVQTTVQFKPPSGQPPIPGTDRLSSSLRASAGVTWP